MTVIYNMSIDRADKPSIGRRRFTEVPLVITGEMITMEMGPCGTSAHVNCRTCLSTNAVHLYSRSSVFV